MAEKGCQSKHVEEGRSRKHEDLKKQKRDKFLELLRQEGFKDDPFECVSDDKMKEISDAIGRKNRGPRKGNSMEEVKMELMKYYYKIKLEELKSKPREWKHKDRKDRKGRKTVHEDSSDAYESTGLQERHPDVRCDCHATEQDSEDGSFEQVNYADLQSTVKPSTSNGHPNQKEAQASPNNGPDDQQEARQADMADHQQQCLDQEYIIWKQGTETKTTDDTPKAETSAHANAIPGSENLDADGGHQTRDEEVAKHPSETRTEAGNIKIEDIRSVDEMKAISSRQLKEILSNNNVDCKTLLERKDLLILVQRLWENTQASSLDGDVSIASACAICMEARMDCAFLECGHMVTCSNCGHKLKECPVCRLYITRVVRIFKC